MIDDHQIVAMYQDKSPIREIKAASGLTRKMIYKRLRAKGIEPNRKASLPWSSIEEQQLIDARMANVTGQELVECVPTRTLAAIKGHIIAMGLTSVGTAE